MTLNRVRFGLLGIFVGFMAIQMGAVIAVSRSMWPEELNALLLKLLGVYSVHLGIILTGIFAQSKRKLPRPAPAMAWTALTLALLWNLLFAWRVLAFSTRPEDSASEVVAYLDTIATASSFLIAGMLAYFFMKSAEGSSPRESAPARGRGHR